MSSDRRVFLRQATVITTGLGPVLYGSRRSLARRSSGGSRVFPASIPFAPLQFPQLAAPRPTPRCTLSPGTPDAGSAVGFVLKFQWSEGEVRDRRYAPRQNYKTNPTEANWTV